jgi:hypothetical protein
MIVETVRGHLDPSHTMRAKGDKYEVSNMQGRYLISICVVREYKESEKVTKPRPKMVTKPERNTLKK